MQGEKHEYLTPSADFQYIYQYVEYTRHKAMAALFKPV